MHLKRKASPKTWPIPKKGTKYLVVPSEKGLPLLIVIRDMLNVANDRKEAKKIIHSKAVFVNNKQVMDEKYALKLFDVLKIGEKTFKIDIQNKKYHLSEVSGKETGSKIAKIIGQKILKEKKVQVNLDDGRNYVTKEKFNMGDSALIDFKEGIKKIIALKEKSKVFIKKGKHTGKIGVIEKLSDSLAEIKVGSDKINVNLSNLIALE